MTAASFGCISNATKAFKPVLESAFRLHPYFLDHSVQKRHRPKLVIRTFDQRKQRLQAESKKKTIVPDKAKCKNLKYFGMIFFVAR
jgi:hypothetical protein